MGLLSHNILLDEDAFARASNELAQLTSDLETLRGKINTMLDGLREGFNTPAGHRFRAACQGGLLTPLDQQRAVINQISQTLESSRTQYQSVFDAYRTLNSTISNSAI